MQNAARESRIQIPISIPAPPRPPRIASIPQEIRELQSQIQNTQVTVEMDNSRELEMKQIVDEVKAQYQAMAAKSREEAEQWYKHKVSGAPPLPCVPRAR